MLRLRTTTELSLLALALGIAGTAWLSTQTIHWRGPAPRLARSDAALSTRALPAPRRAPAPARVVQAYHVSQTTDNETGSPATAAAPSPPSLVPLATPADTAQPWYQLRGHLDGRVLLQLDIDGSGRVSAASVSESSGDSVLDAHALRSVLSWRFAVPADHPDGFSGELPMRFSSQPERIAQLP